MIASILRSLTLNNDERGQGLAEYGLILALVSVAAVAALTTFSGNIGSVLSSVGSKL
jgi:pilus assembly protein Flp/PilA